MIREHHLRVARTARYAVLGDPGTAVRELWIACHGFGQLAARFLRRFEGLAAPHRLIAAPEALNRFYVDPPASVADAAKRRVGATWMTREERDADIADYVGYLDGLHALLIGESPAAETVALGFSQGVSTVCRWVAHGGARPRRLVLWSGSLPPELEPARLADRLDGGRVDFVLGESDLVVPPSLVESSAARLREAGASCTVWRHARGHEIDAATLARLVAPPGAATGEAAVDAPSLLAPD